MSFDTVAPWYRTLETIAFGNALQRCRVACLGEIRPPRQALIVGEGNGRFLCELLRAQPEVEVDCIDESERMLELTRRRLENELPGGRDRVRFRQHDITHWTPPRNQYDLIVTHFLLDCFREAELVHVIEALGAAGKPEAECLVADFRLPEQGFARLRARAWLAVMYQFFRFAARISATELVDPTPLLQEQGFALARQHLFRSGILKSELWKRGGHN